MELEPRLEILRQGGLLSDENYDLLRRVIQYFSEKQGFALMEENAAAFVTHLAAALERVRRGEPVAAMDPAVYRGASEEPTFPRASQIGAEILRMCPQLPPEEVQFINVHVGVMLAHQTCDAAGARPAERINSEAERGK